MGCGSSAQTDDMTEFSWCINAEEFSEQFGDTLTDFSTVKYIGFDNDECLGSFGSIAVLHGMVYDYTYGQPEQSEKMMENLKNLAIKHYMPKSTRIGLPDVFLRIHNMLEKGTINHFAMYTNAGCAHGNCERAHEDFYKKKIGHYTNWLAQTLTGYARVTYPEISENLYTKVLHFFTAAQTLKKFKRKLRRAGHYEDNVDQLRKNICFMRDTGDMDGIYEVDITSGEETAAGALFFDDKEETVYPGKNGMVVGTPEFHGCPNWKKMSTIIRGIPEIYEFGIRKGYWYEGGRDKDGEKMFSGEGEFCMKFFKPQMKKCQVHYETKIAQGRDRDLGCECFMKQFDILEAAVSGGNNLRRRMLDSEAFAELPIVNM